MKATDLAYAAGLIDGEGNIAVKKRIDRRTFTAWVRVEMCDREPLEWLKARFGGSNILMFTKKKKPHHRPTYGWCMASKQAANALRLLLPYMIVKRRQALAVLELQEVNRAIQINTNRQRRERRGPTPMGHFDVPVELSQRTRELYEVTRRLNQRGIAA